jgi:hypothetical protein
VTITIIIFDTLAYTEKLETQLATKTGMILVKWMLGVVIAATVLPLLKKMF